MNLGYPTFHWDNNHRPQPLLKAYRTRVLKQAGQSRQNYLRSMFADGFFQKSPQEFVASIANMYFSSTEDTFLYALDKARSGNHNQLNQFLLLASAYADDKSCPFYRIDPSGQTTVKRCPIQRTDGVVTTIVYRGQEIHFTLEDGLVTGFSPQ